MENSKKEGEGSKRQKFQRKVGSLSCFNIQRGGDLELEEKHFHGRSVDIFWHNAMYWLRNKISENFFLTHHWGLGLRCCLSVDHCLPLLLNISEPQFPRNPLFELITYA